MTTEKATPKFTRKERLTVGFTSMAHRKNLFCEVLTEPFRSDIEFSNGKDKSCPMICSIIDMETGEGSWLICSAIILSVFEKYSGKLVGACFEISQAPKIEGKKYRALDIYEIEPKEG